MRALVRREGDHYYASLAVFRTVLPLAVQPTRQQAVKVAVDLLEAAVRELQAQYEEAPNA